VLSRFLINPPAGFTATDNVSPSLSTTEQAPLPSVPELTGKEILVTVTFWKLWFLYFVGAGAGLMVIGNLAGMAKSSMGDAAFIAVAIMAVGNASGRIIAGVVSDALGRSMALAIFLGLQALNMFLAIIVVSSEGSIAFFIVLSATFIGFNYGTNLALFPAFCKSAWGIKSMGVNYGMLFTAWGVGGFMMSRLSSMLVSSTGSFASSFLVAGILLAIAAIVALRMKEPETAS